MSQQPSANLRLAHEIIAGHCEEIAALFKDRMKVTVVVRHPEHPDGSRDVLVTTDEVEKVAAAILQLHADPTAVRTGPGT